ncbi:MAG: metallophosphoesterase [Opitutaceae bacterium]|nr:metallophosphoesterase [Opitutaceae bacterium]
MNPRPTRRTFLKHSAAAVAAACVPRALSAAAPATSFSFVLLGDLHYDALAHHDMAWVEKEKPNDISQIKNYSRITAEITPRLLATVRETIAELNRTPATRVAFVLQAGDLVEGLCGSEELAVRQNTEALAAIRDAQLGAPLLFTKGNHDITGPGAVAAFASVFHPFLAGQARAIAPGGEAVAGANFSVEVGGAQVVFFDAYEAAKSLAWLEAIAARRTAEHLFVAVHPPVVPYGARSTWHVFASERDRARREKFLALLGEQRALVLGGHIHRYNTLSRAAGRGRFAQFALSSVLSTPGPKPKDILDGATAYTSDQISVEPNFSPANAAERRAVYEAERAHVRDFTYADLPGYAVVTVAGPRVTATMFAGTTREPWRTVDLAALARG